MSFVGGGGDYAPSGYQYVGRGAGQYSVAETRVPRGVNWCCILLIPLLILLLLLMIPLLYHLLHPNPTVVPVPAYAPPPVAPAPEAQPVQPSPITSNGGML